MEKLINIYKDGKTYTDYIIVENSSDEIQDIMLNNQDVYLYKVYKLLNENDTSEKKKVKFAGIMLEYNNHNYMLTSNYLSYINIKTIEADDEQDRAFGRITIREFNIKTLNVYIEVLEGLLEAVKIVKNVYNSSVLERNISKNTEQLGLAITKKRDYVISKRLSNTDI